MGAFLLPIIHLRLCGIIAGRHGGVLFEELMLSLIQKIFPSKNERELKRMQPLVDQINALEPEIERLSDEGLRGKTAEFRERLAKGEALDELLPEAFAVVREAGKRTMGMRHYDVQMIGGMVLHRGRIAEMRTGEGKTLVATLTVYLNALEGKGVHVITVNDYLAERDSLGRGSFKGMGEIYRFLGLTVGCIKHDMRPAEHKAAYACDITYGTNNEFGFDYLRDHMALHPDHRVQRGLHYALVDEVDSILIDEARTPLIISGPAEESTTKYAQVDRLIPRLKKDEHYTVEEKTRTVALNDQGVEAAEEFLALKNLYEPHNIEWVHHIQQALRAHVLYKLDVDYVVKEGQVILVDEFTGRLMPGRRFGEGLHQALEAKEGVRIERENQTLATISLQNYFRLYKKLAGMTGTAETEAAEFYEIYKLDVTVIPTHRPMVRIDNPDVVYKSVKGKFKAVADEIAECNRLGQPVLVGTVSIEKNEALAELLKRRGVKHEVLNAKNHEREAEIISRAGQKGSVTIATNMAGRGTDIVLGEGVIELGGLHVIGTERHESRRIDNQLRGRAGRQGDPGSSRFYVSLEDDLMRIFGSERISAIMGKLGMTEDEAIEHSIISKSIERAQKTVEGHNFDIRKHLLQYDDVMNKQREVVYTRREAILEGQDIQAEVLGMLQDIVEAHFSANAPAETHPEEWDLNPFVAWFEETFKAPASDLLPKDMGKAGGEDLKRAFMRRAEEAYARKEAEMGSEELRGLERYLTLEALDGLWKDLLLAMDKIKEGIGLQAYGQKDPLLEYKKEAYNAFSEMMATVKEEVIPMLMRVAKADPERQLAPAAPDPHQMRLQESRPEFTAPGQQAPMIAAQGAEPQPQAKAKVVVEPIKRDLPKVGRNDVCPCGSGKKYKKCHGAA
jgi:preprotein translocase subunit SecA